MLIFYYVRNCVSKYEVRVVCIFIVFVIWVTFFKCEIILGVGDWSIKCSNERFSRNRKERRFLFNTRL